MEPADIELYEKALADGMEQVCNIRVMIVGHFGVGKTVLTKRLMNKHQYIDISTRIPTEGIDVHVGKMTVNLIDGKWVQQTSGKIFIFAQLIIIIGHN
jgi:GTPase SAR1 family protein